MKTKIKKIYSIGFLKEIWFKQTILQVFLTFILIGCLGAWYNSYLQNKLDERQRKYENYKFQLDKKDSTINMVAENINLRYLNSDRIISSINSDKIWLDYMSSVTEWNLKIEQMRSNIATYYTDRWDMASELIDYTESTDISSDSIPKSIHYKFVKLHKYIIEIKKGDKSKIKYAEILLSKIREQKDKLLTSMIEDQIIINGNLK